MLGSRERYRSMDIEYKELRRKIGATTDNDIKKNKLTELVRTKNTMEKR